MASSVSLAAFALALLVAQQGCAEASLMGRGSEHEDLIYLLYFEVGLCTLQINTIHVLRCTQ